jgi:hemerythrin-like domain-containing protein
MTHAFASAVAQDQWQTELHLPGDCDLNIDPRAPAGRPETAQMTVVHKALRRELSLLPGVVGAVAADDRRRSARIARHARLVLTLLREHHDSEDRLLWPVLRSRAPRSDTLIDTVEAQHRIIADLSVGCQPEFASWSHTGDPDQRNRIVEELSELGRALLASLDFEESNMFPAIRQHFSVHEWSELQKQAIDNSASGPRARLILAGVALEDATPLEGAWFMKMMPSPRRLQWHAFGGRWYVRYARDIRRDVR